MTEGIGRAIGSLVSCGWTLEEVLDLTFAQLVLCNEFVWDHRATMLAELVEPLKAGLTGSKYKAPALKERSVSRADKEKQMLRDLEGMGVVRHE